MDTTLFGEYPYGIDVVQTRANKMSDTGKPSYGLIGLGTMGSNLALNIAEKGSAIAVFNRTANHRLLAPA